MGTDTMSSGVAGASVPAPSAGDVLRFAAYLADLIGDDRLVRVSWDVAEVRLAVEVTETTHGETVAHLLGLPPRSDVAPDFNSEGFSCWRGISGNVPVFLTAPLALGGLPRRRAWDWSDETSADDVKAVA